MICVFHSLGVKHGQDLSVIRSWTNGGLGLAMDKLLGILSVHRKLCLKSAEFSKFASH